MGAPATNRGRLWEVFVAFLVLGLRSFGGPAAHLGYFRSEFVTRRGWYTDRDYAELVALCQFLPGPASSQVGFGIGLQRAGVTGGLAAFVGFTLPSAILMFAFATGAAAISGPIGDGVLTGLKVVAVAIVADAVLGMARSLTPDLRRASIAVLAAITALWLPGPAAQLVAIAGGALAGVLLLRSIGDSSSAPLRSPVSRRAAIACLVVSGALLIVTPALATASGSGALSLFSAFVRAGSLVFGGGHVVLPLLEAGVVHPGWVSDADFFAGYGAAQAVPGPLFTISSYLGAVSTVGPGGAAGAAIALAGIFLPGFLLLAGVLPFWGALASRRWARGLVSGANASVVGILAAALYTPVFTTAVTSFGSLTLALVCFLLLRVSRLPVWVTVLGGAGGGILLGILP